MSEWTHLETDVLELVEDGDTVEITTGGNRYRLKALWVGVHSDQNWEQCAVATDQLPEGWAQGDTLERAGVTYTISRNEPDGHGLTRLLLTLESRL